MLHPEDHTLLPGLTPGDGLLPADSLLEDDVPGAEEPELQELLCRMLDAVNAAEDLSAAESALLQLICRRICTDAAACCPGRRPGECLLRRRDLRSFTELPEHAILRLLKSLCRKEYLKLRLSSGPPRRLLAGLRRLSPRDPGSPERLPQPGAAESAPGDPGAAASRAAFPGDSLPELKAVLEGRGHLPEGIRLTLEALERLLPGSPGENELHPRQPLLPPRSRTRGGPGFNRRLAGYLRREAADCRCAWTRALALQQHAVLLIRSLDELQSKYAAPAESCCSAAAAAVATGGGAASTAAAPAAAATPLATAAAPAAAAATPLVTAATPAAAAAVTPPAIAAIPAAAAAAAVPCSAAGYAAPAAVSGAVAALKAGAEIAALKQRIDSIFEEFLRKITACYRKFLAESSEALEAAADLCSLLQNLEEQQPAGEPAVAPEEAGWVQLKILEGAAAGRRRARHCLEQEYAAASKALTQIREQYAKLKEQYALSPKYARSALSPAAPKSRPAPAPRKP